jgi:probable 2-oxoglutarate dehydrogenase E1 component DHKTD1
LAYKAAELSVKYRNKFAKDIVVDLVCFRKYGHNELDDPSFTNPVMYNKINSRLSVPDLYEQKLVQQENLIQKDRLDKELIAFKSSLNNALEKVVSDSYKIEERNTYLNKGEWSKMQVSSYTERTKWNTGCDTDFLKYIGVKSVSTPQDFVS